MTQIRTEQNERLGHELAKARVTDQAWKLNPQMRSHVFRVERLEVSVMRLMKEHQKGHDLTEAQAARPLALA